MNFSRLVLTCVAAPLLVACGALQPPIGAPGAKSQSRGDRVRTAGTSGDLIYVSDVEEDLYIYSYPEGKLVGGFDNAGNLFVDRPEG
jgi:hypothetical protein